MAMASEISGARLRASAAVSITTTLMSGTTLQMFMAIRSPKTFPLRSAYRLYLHTAKDVV
jgi:hypothetical protein